MPNYCNYEMKVKGSKKAIQRVVKCLEADYNYSLGIKPEKHFFRVFDVYYDKPYKNEDGTYTLIIGGYCAWSVYSAMLDTGDTSYYGSLKHDYPTIFNGTTLEEQSKNCEIEVFSEEEGMGFSEHYLFKNGKCLIDETADIEQAGYTKTGKISKRINWDTYDGDYVCLNPHRENQTEGYLWVIK